jgi:hypothetical protein
MPLRYKAFFRSAGIGGLRQLVRAQVAAKPVAASLDRKNRAIPPGFFG